MKILTRLFQRAVGTVLRRAVETVDRFFSPSHNLMTSSLHLPSQFKCPRVRLLELPLPNRERDEERSY